MAMPQKTTTFDYKHAISPKKCPKSLSYGITNIGSFVTQHLWKVAQTKIQMSPIDLFGKLNLMTKILA